MASSVWRGHISFGLVTIPVRLYKAARKERVKLREVYRVDTASERTTEEPDAEIDIEDNARVPDLRPEVAETPPVLAPVRRVSVEESGHILPTPAIEKVLNLKRGDS